MMARTNETDMNELIVILGVVVIGIIIANAFGVQEWVDSKIQPRNE